MFVFVCLIIVFVSICPQRNEPRCWAEYLSLQSISRRCFASRLTITNQDIMIRVSLKIKNTFLRPVYLLPTAHMYKESRTPIARLKTLNLSKSAIVFFYLKGEMSIKCAIFGNFQKLSQFATKSGPRSWFPASEVPFFAPKIAENGRLQVPKKGNSDARIRLYQNLR